VLERDLPGGQASHAAMIENFFGFPEGIGGAELAPGRRHHDDPSAGLPDPRHQADRLVRRELRRAVGEDVGQLIGGHRSCEQISLSQVAPEALQ